jgi:hypothetical protein
VVLKITNADAGEENEPKEHVTESTVRSIRERDACNLRGPSFTLLESAMSRQFDKADLDETRREELRAVWLFESD